MRLFRRTPRSRARLAAFTAAILALAVLTPTAPAFAADAATVNVTKGNDLGGQPLKAGDDVTYNLYLSCSSIEVDCVGFTFVDVLPEGLVLDAASLPSSTPTRLVDYAESTRTLTISYRQALDNPVGQGLTAGMNETLDIRMTLPADTTLADGAQLENTATVDAENAEPKTASNTVAVSVPKVTSPVATKAWTGASAVAGSRSASSVQLGIRNASSSSADVRELAVTDRGAGTFDRFDVAGVTLVSFPPGADTAELFVCADPTMACGDDAFVGGSTLTAAGTFAIPAGIDSGTITGVRVIFSNADGSKIPTSATQGRVDLSVTLRDTIRSTGAEQKPVDRVTVKNCATPTARDASGAVTAGTDVCANKDVLPDTLMLNASKTFFPDTNHNFTRDNGEYAVVGQGSGVSAIVQAKNNSPFPISELTITEPAATTPAEFDKFDAESVRLTLPAGAASARLVRTYSNGDVHDDTYTANTTVTLAPAAGVRLTAVTVTYAGRDGGATIEAGSTAALGLTGRLNGLVTDADLPGGTSPGVDNCARVTGSAGRADGTGTATANACNTLAVESPRSSGTGVKNVERSSIPAGEPIPFTLRYTNNGNLPLASAVITDPPTDASGRPLAQGNPFATLRITGATVSKTTNTGTATIEVFDPSADAWVPFAASNAALLERATGIRATLAGDLAPTQYFQLNLTTERRDGAADGIALSNCFILGADGYVGAQPSCSPAISTGPAADGATVNKSISPSVLPTHVPGLPKQYATVNLSVRNTGNLSARELGVQDGDPTFFDSVDFVDLQQPTFPATSGGSNRVRIDAFVAGAWVLGTPAGTASLPATLKAADVRGIRAVFSSTSTVNGGNVITPCATDRCDAKISFRVTPRETLRSDADTDVVSPIDNAATGLYATRLQTPGNWETTDTVTSSFSLNDGTPKLDVDKTPDAAIAPGESTPFTLKVTNNGTSSIPNLRVVDALPAGLAFDETFVGDGGQPFQVTATDVPAGTPAVPTPTLTLTRDGEHVSQAAFDFGAWVFAPGATLSIVVQAKLEPGVVAGQLLTNTMAAGSTVPGLVCTTGDGTSTDGTYGAGTLCTDTATARTRAGASFEARKWVSGNPALGWFNTRTAQPAAIGDAGCPAYTEGGVTYTATPCIALVNPGDTFDYLIRVRNAGTEPGTQMTIVDRFPVKGDTGVLGADRGTQWDNRPVLTRAPDVRGGGPALQLGYSTTKTLCTEDLDLGSAATCAPGDWASAYTPDATAFQAVMNFRQAPLAPGAGVTIAFSMTTPLDVSRVSDPTIAWNSVAHAETTQQGNGRDRVLAPVEPIKVGVATSYGSLELEKAIGENPAKVDTDGAEFTFAYECTVIPRGGVSTVVTSGERTMRAGEKATVRQIPAGADCAVWESDADGAVSDHSSRETAAHVTIEPHFGAGEQAADRIPTATVSNSYPLGVLRVTKTVTGEAAAYGAGPFTVDVSCLYNGAAVPGFPRTLTFDAAGTQDVAAPVGALCTTSETDDGGATESTVTPATPVLVPATTTETAGGSIHLAAVDVTNRFDAGALVINKRLAGVGVSANPDGTYVFRVACAFNGVNDVFVKDVSLIAHDGATALTSDAITGLPLGAVCTVTETDNGGADSTPPPVTVTIAADTTTGNTATVGFVNDYSAGVVELTKNVKGALADQDFVTDSTFRVQVTCQVPMTDAAGDDVLATLFEGDVDIRAGETSRLDGVLLPVGARCFGVETETGGATTSVVTPATFDDAKPVTAGTPETAQVLGIVAVNTFDAATVSVTKRAVNAPDANAVYSFHLSCATGPHQDEDFTLRADETREFTVVAGSICRVVETPVPDGAIVTIADDDASTGTTTDGIVVATGSQAITVTNTFPAPLAGSDQPGLSATGAGGIGAAGRVALFLLITGAMLLTLRRLQRKRLESRP